MKKLRPGKPDSGFRGKLLSAEKNAEKVAEELEQAAQMRKSSEMIRPTKHSVFPFRMH